MVTGKADSLDLLEGMSPGRAMANGRTPPETKNGACAQRGSLGTREDRKLLVREETGKATGIQEGQTLAGGLQPDGEKRTKGDWRGTGERASSEVSWDGEAVVLAERSTEGRVI